MKRVYINDHYEWQEEEPLTAEEIKFQKLSEIESLKQELSNSDYKIIKCFEASLKNETMPYDIETLIAERKEKRNRINQLESEA